MNESVVDKIILKPYKDNDFIDVYEAFSLYNGKEFIKYDEKFFHRLNFYSEFKKNLKKNYISFFIICDNEKKKNIGFLYCYNYDIKNQNIFFDLFLSFQEYYESIELKRKVISYLNSLIIDRRIRKVYSHSFVYEKQKLIFLKECNFIEIGLMKEYRYYKKNYIDLKILELT